MNSEKNRNDEKQNALEQEIATHLEMFARDREERGATPQQAAEDARREFGNVALVEHVTRDQWRGRWLEDLTQDLRHGARLLRRNLGFTIIAVLTLALGIGANTAIFSLVNGILLRPLPYARANELVSINGTYPKGGLAALRERSKTMDLAAYAEGYEFNLTGLGDPIRLSGTPVSAELFSILGAEPAIGHTFRTGDDAAGKSSFVILSNSLWQRQFHSDPNIIGHLITLDGVQRQIVGVMPANFHFPSAQTEVWIPLNIDPRDAHSYWGGDYMPTIARLRSGATLQQADSEIRFLQPQIATLFPWKMPKTWNPDLAAVSLQTGLIGDVRERLLILLVAVVLVLLIACANVANLTLSRASVREKEIAIRASMGAARHRIVRQLITESVLMASFGGAIGLFLADAGLTLLKSTLPADTPGLLSVALDWRAILFVGELALAVLLVSGAGLLIRSLWALSHVNPGFHSDNVLTARITPNQNFCADQGRCFSFYRDLLREVRVLPGIDEASLINTLPLDGRLQKRSSDVEDYVPTADKPSPLFWLNTVSPGYFNSMRIPIMSGREFNEADTTGNPRSIIISAETARRYFPAQDAVGKHIRLVGEEDWATIVGVANDVRAYDLRRNLPDWIDGMIYVPYGPGATREDGSVPAEMTLVLRSSIAAPQLEQTIRSVATSLNPEAPVSEVKAMPQILSGETAAPRAIASLFAAFAALALVLGIIGIYGVISFFVGQRTREIGIRIAMGAQRRDILKLVINEGLTLTVIGIVVGLGSAFALTRFLAAFLYGVSATDPLDFAAVAALFGVVALAASYIPARRAMRVDPLTALRYE